MKKVLIIIAVSMIFIFGVVMLLGWHGYRAAMQAKSSKYDDNLLILEGGGGNSIVLTSEDGTQALVVDTKMGGASKQLAAVVKAKDITIVNTHLHSDHVGGNGLFPKATIIAGAYTQEQWKSLAKTSRYPDKVIQIGQDTIIKIGNETVHIRNMGKAHTWDDVIVYLENRKFLVTGDIVFNHMHPALFVQGGSNVASWVAVIDSLIKDYDAAHVLPGHGALSDKNALIDMKDYFVTIKAAIGNPEKMTAAKEKYKSYYNIPVLTGFDRTAAFIENEEKNK
jgi:cyclase